MQILFPLRLYSTTHCHLCDEAVQLIHETVTTKELAIIEIADDDQLLLTYGLRIPVLQRMDTLAELDWPFTAIDIDQFLGRKFINQ